MIAHSSNNHFVISDSDILVTPDFLRNMISPLLDPQVGLVTCLYSGTPTEDFWSRVEALGMSIEMPSGVLVAKLMEGMKFALGASIALHRDALDSIGGIASISDYCADDFILGKRIAESGYSVVLSRQIVSHILIGTGICPNVPCAASLDAEHAFFAAQRPPWNGTYFLHAFRSAGVVLGHFAWVLAARRRPHGMGVF